MSNEFLFSGTSRRQYYARLSPEGVYQPPTGAILRTSMARAEEDAHLSSNLDRSDPILILARADRIKDRIVEKQLGKRLTDGGPVPVTVQVVPYLQSEEILLVNADHIPSDDLTRIVDPYFPTMP